MRGQGLKEVNAMVGTGDSTSDTQIDNTMKEVFPNKYMGIFVDSKPAHVPEGKIAILFDGPRELGHWRAVYRKNGVLYEYDSYQRDVEGATYRDGWKETKVRKQGPHETNCGQRTINFLMKVFPRHSER